MPVTVQELNGPDPMTQAMDAEGITPAKLAKMLRQGLEAKVTKTMKVKGLIRQQDLPRGFRVVATSGVIIKDRDGVETASDGDTVIMWHEVSHDERRQNRIDAQRLRGAYPAENHNVNIKTPVTLRVIYDDKPKQGDTDDA